MISPASILPYAEIALAVILVALILLQRTGAQLGGAFGGQDNWSSAYHTRRGMERVLFFASIIVAILFAGLCLLSLVK